MSLKALRSAERAGVREKDVKSDKCQKRNLRNT
jgi:hypothetical protein